MAKSSSFTHLFPEALFRSSIRDTMLMGIPENPAERLTFFWRRSRVFSPDDPAGNPYSWTAAPVTNTPGNPAVADTGGDQGLSVPYALEFVPRAAGGAATTFGDIQTSRIIVTVMDTDFAQIKTADYAIIGPTTYHILYDAPPVGLFGVTIHSFYLEAQDST